MWRKKKSLREQRNQSVFKEQRARIAQPCDSAQQQSSLRLEQSRLPMALRMRASLFMCCCVLALQCFPSTLCSPVRGSSRYKVAPVSRRMLLALLFVEAAAEFGDVLDVCVRVSYRVIEVNRFTLSYFEESCTFFFPFFPFFVLRWTPPARAHSPTHVRGLCFFCLNNSFTSEFNVLCQRTLKI